MILTYYFLVVEIFMKLLKYSGIIIDSVSLKLYLDNASELQ